MFDIRRTALWSRVALAAAGVVISACSSTPKVQPAKLVPGDSEFQAKLNSLARMYESRDVGQIMSSYAQDVYSLSFDLPYKFDSNSASHRGSLERTLGQTKELHATFAPNAEIWRAPDRVWTISYLKAAGLMNNGDTFTFDGWHSAVWEPRSGKWVIAYEHFAGPFTLIPVAPPPPPSAPPATPPPPPEPTLEESLADVFFNYDKWDIRADQVPVAMADAELLRNTPSAQIVIEGHCDERGTMEYNIRLGQRRAESMKRFLVEHGVAAERIKTISFGKSRPFELGRGEPMWGKNRRAHMVVISK